MSTNGIRKRLEELEERTFGADPFRDFPDWDLVDQLESVADTLHFFRRFHRDGRVRYPATDRELHLLGLLCALWEIGGPGAAGAHRFEGTDLVVTWRDNGDGTHNARASRWTRLEDLPEDVRVHFERMEPAKHTERERWLFQNRDRAAEHRRWMREREAAGTFRPADRGEGGR